MNAANKKGCILASAPFWREADKMSKAALIDLLHDYVVRCMGEDAAVEKRLQELRISANVVLALRNDRLLK
jgi:hypothetical protein